MGAQSHSSPVNREGRLDAIIAFGETLQVGSKRLEGPAPRRARALQSAGFFVFGVLRQGYGSGIDASLLAPVWYRFGQI